MPDIVLRPGTDADRGYIKKSWIREYSTSPEGRRAGPNYCEGHSLVIDRILSRARVLVATSERDPVPVLGFVVAEGPIVHYVYVQDKLRRFGIARQLLAPYLEAEKIRYSHSPRPEIAARLPATWIYDPYCRTEGNYEGKRERAA